MIRSSRLPSPAGVRSPRHRVYRLFRELRRRGVNNRRTRAIIRDWMAGRRDPAFDLVKYRSAVKAAVKHAHLRLPGEQRAFLFAPSGVRAFETPLFERWRRAHYEQSAIYELPYTVAEGFAAKHRIPREVFLERIRPRMTRLDPGHRLAPGQRVMIVHLNPVYDADDFDVRRPAPAVPTAGVRDAEDLPALVEPAQFAEGRVGLDRLRAHLDDRAARFLGDVT